VLIIDKFVWKLLIKKTLKKILQGF